ncbi:MULTISPECIES: Trm112 family protein [Larsenimonas]|uniref:UPF0434 protein QC825_07005 n=1 Tax=Larsenimonas suaedae TaxID=1851019 RepID=A0ABU1GW90_9GAMM|nr:MULTISPECIES: Trm112 family protein [Larsenimonas]MCM2971108.1 Trm112 family protein [Larsenimonas suaedae]MCM5703214.1 Trm112 family protein [Larsenimonas salina]MDR5895817.1 Trm112 family protein [Larsenimonas suaedae]
MDKELLAMLVCPQSQEALEFDKTANELVCRQSGLAYPVRDGIPVMIVEEARVLDADEVMAKRS